MAALHSIARDLSLRGYTKMKKNDLIVAIQKTKQGENDGSVKRKGDRVEASDETKTEKGSPLKRRPKPKKGVKAWMVVDQNKKGHQNDNGTASRFKKLKRDHTTASLMAGSYSCSDDEYPTGQNYPPSEMASCTMDADEDCTMTAYDNTGEVDEKACETEVEETEIEESEEEDDESSCIEDEEDEDEFDYDDGIKRVLANPF